MLIAILFLHSLLCVSLILVKPYSQLNLLKKQFSSLEIQWQGMNKISLQNNKIEEQLRFWKINNKNILHYLKASGTPMNFYKKISNLANTHHLQMLKLKSELSQKNFNFNQKIFDIEVVGSELNIINFLHLLVLQPQVTEIKQLELSLLKRDIHLQVHIAVYFCE